MQKRAKTNMNRRRTRVDPEEDEPVKRVCVETTRTDVNFLVVGDTHFSVSNEGETDIMSQNLMRLLIKRLDSTDVIVLLGDILDRLHMASLAKASRWINDLQLLKPVYILVGNHDRTNHAEFQTNVHPFVGLGFMPNIRVIDRAEFITLHDM